MIIAIHATENRYGGLHGIENHRIIEVDSIEEAVEQACQDSREVIWDYGIADEILADIDGADVPEDEQEDCLEECIQEEIAFELWEVIDDYTNSLAIMENDFYNDLDTFVKEHCKPIEEW